MACALPLPVVYVPAAGVFFLKQTRPMIFGACISLLGVLECVSAPPGKIFKIWSI